MKIVCENGHIVVKEAHCLYCNGPLSLGGRRPTKKQTVVICNKCWRKPNNYQRNITIRDFLSFLKIEKCPKCEASQFFFEKE